MRHGQVTYSACDSYSETSCVACVSQTWTCHARRSNCKNVTCEFLIRYGSIDVTYSIFLEAQLKKNCLLKHVTFSRGHSLCQAELKHPEQRVWWDEKRFTMKVDWLLFFTRIESGIPFKLFFFGDFWAEENVLEITYPYNERRFSLCTRNAVSKWWPRREETQSLHKESNLQVMNVRKDKQNYRTQLCCIETAYRFCSPQLLSGKTAVTSLFSQRKLIQSWQCGTEYRHTLPNLQGLRSPSEAILETD